MRAVDLPMSSYHAIAMRQRSASTAAETSPLSSSPGGAYYIAYRTTRLSSPLTRQTEPPVLSKPKWLARAIALA